MTNFVIAVTTCSKHLSTRVPYIEKYCLQTAPHFLFTGNIKKLKKQHIPLNCLDDYFSLRLKTFAIFNWFLSTKYEYLVKCDDDTFIDCKEIEKLLPAAYIGAFTTFSKSKESIIYHLDYIYKITQRRQDLSYFKEMLFDFKYAEGSCYILDRNSVERIVKYELDNKIPGIIQEDITVGYIAHLLNVHITDFTLPLQWYGNTHFSFHPCKEALFPILASKSNLADRVDTLKKLLIYNNHYQKYFDLG